MEVPRLGVQSELQPLAYTTATATQDLSCVCKLYHSSQQCRDLRPLNEARDGTRILMATGRVLNLLSHKGNSRKGQILTVGCCLFVVVVVVVVVVVLTACRSSQARDGTHAIAVTQATELTMPGL